MILGGHEEEMVKGGACGRERHGGRYGPWGLTRDGQGVGERDPVRGWGAGHMHKGSECDIWLTVD